MNADYFISVGAGKPAIVHPEPGVIIALATSMKNAQTIVNALNR